MSSFKHPCLSINSLYSLPKRSIYNKDKFLDKAQYKADENEYTSAYLKEKLDTESLTKEEREQVMQQLKDHEVKAQSDKYNEEERKFMDVDVMKNILDMSEIEANPNSNKAKEFENKMEEFERQNPNKRKTQVFIKTMKSGRTVSNDKRTTGKSDLFGHDKLSEQAYNYLAHQFPEENYLGKF
jgi:hypothetical protein